MQLAERFGGWPGTYASMPADDVSYWLGLLGIEAQTASDLEGVGPEDEYIDADDHEALTR